MSSTKKQKDAVSTAASRSVASRTSKRGAQGRFPDGRTTATRSRTEYAVCYADYDDCPDFGCYCTFETRGAALDYATEMVFTRAMDRGSEILDSSDWKTVMTHKQVRDHLAQGYAFQLVDRFHEFVDGAKDPGEYVSICVTEIEHREK